MSTFHLNRFGLINFWYHGDTVFEFSNGRLFVRGANGSGKSVSTTMAVPFLLDGDKRPSRLDPFGSQDRRMIDLLLGNKHVSKREEGTGYLYIEYRKGNTFVTVGIGLNGKRRESDNTMRTWYFILRNKRIGYDIQLYDEKIVSGEAKKFPLTRRDLADRIGGDGEVTDSQQRYVEIVNQEIYRFKTTQEFKELIGVLLQLRSPKLSNAVKASEVSNVLSDALPELSQYELAPLSSALESMDSLQEKKTRYGRELGFLTMLADAYDTYNQLSLYEKARYLVSSEKRFNESMKRMKNYKTSEAAALVTKTNLERQWTEQSNIKETLQRKIVSLQDHPLFTLEEELGKVKDALQESENKLRDKAEAMEENKGQQRHVEDRIKRSEEEEYKAAQSREDALSEMESLADEAYFLSHTALSQHFESSLESFPDAGFKNWQETLQGYHGKVQDIASQLRSLQSRLEHEDRMQRHVAIEEEREEGIEAEIRALEKGIAECAASVEHAVIEWAEGAQQFQVQSTELLEAKEILQGVGDLLDDSSPAAVTDWLNVLYNKRLGALQEERANLTASIGLLQKQIEETKTKVEELSAQTEIEPDLTASEVVEMERLRAQNIRAAYFYETVEFMENIEPSVKEAIEGAITRAGLLTALVVHESDRSMVAASMTVVQTGSYKEENLLTYMRSTPINGLSEADIRAVLQTISIVPHEEGYVLETGEFRSGMVGGLAPRYEDAYIGKSAREQIQARRLKELQKLLEELIHKKDNLKSKRFSVEKQQSLLHMERDMFPSLEGLKDSLACHENKTLERVAQLSLLERLQNDLRVYRNETQVARNALHYVAQELELPLTHASYQQALGDIARYKEMLAELRVAHTAWLAEIKSLSDLTAEKERLVDHYEFLTDEKTDLERSIARNKSLEAMYLERIEDLGDTDVKQEIEEARKAAQAADQLLGNYGKQITEAESNIRTLAENHEKEQPQMEERLRLLNAWTKLYQEELSLGFVCPPQSASQVVKALEETCKALSSDVVLSALKDAEGHAQRELVDYNLKQSRRTIQLEIQAKDKEDPFWQILEQHCSRQFLVFLPQHVESTPREVHRDVDNQLKLISQHIQEEEQKLFEKVLIDVVGTAIHEKVRAAKRWEQDANVMLQRVTGTIQMRLEWVPLTSKEEDQISTTELLSYLSKESIYLTPSQKEKVRLHFMSKINEARKKCKDDASFSMFEELKNALDYRRWFRFDMFITRKGIPEERFTNKVFGELSGGEKAMSIYSPLFAAIAAKYSYAAPDAPRIISLDEAFAGIDSENIAQMFQLVHDFEFDYIMNSQVLWGCYETVDKLSIAQILRSVDSPVLAVARYYWDGKEKHHLSLEQSIEEHSRNAG
ncbi:TIGR02680 family protein [Brevibacillus laterosporus]|uniref:TIGR02680 family protein n=1 Tax=Brevibacillus laterosporus TaxID=1465 RepID=UPI003D19B244